MYTRREYLRQQVNRDRSWAILGCAAATSVAAGVYASSDPSFEQLAVLFVLVSGVLGGVLRYNHDKAVVERIRRELDQL